MGLVRRLDGLERRWSTGADGRMSRKFAATVAGLWLAISAIPLGAAVWNARHDRNVAGALREGGVVAPAEVVDRRGGGRLAEIAGSQAQVRFTTESGDVVTTWVTVDEAPRYGPARVVYLRRDPRVARLAGDLVPRDGPGPVVVGLLFLVGFGGSLAVGVWRRR